MRKCEECGRIAVEFAYDTGHLEIWECKFCCARYTLDPDFGELMRYNDSE